MLKKKKTVRHSPESKIKWNHHLAGCQRPQRLRCLCRWPLSALSGDNRNYFQKCLQGVAQTRGIFLVHKEESVTLVITNLAADKRKSFLPPGRTKIPAIWKCQWWCPSASACSFGNSSWNWLKGRPKSYCDTTDKKLLRSILPAFDQETPDFYRWQVVYTRKEMEEIIRKKSSMIWCPAKHRASWARAIRRISRLKIEGSKEL